eukprot:TRINITY_DN3192_c0_g1_i1.p2 TRINITY_DN3192_c0_g1~~TRINITY_DN3192_c0_g1_i1.p2  ORF type:complete len:401 (+),score=83.92 TRINITY_DN3192_c0_g1_i1:284-1486(+)
MNIQLQKQGLPKDFEEGCVERAARLEYDVESNTWTKDIVYICMEKNVFARGAMRAAYRCVPVDKSGRIIGKILLAKFYIDPELASRETYYKDVKAQKICQLWAQEYNLRCPPKQVSFVNAYIFDLVDRPGRPVCGVEDFLEGTFEKHNTNVGGTQGMGEWPDERNTPQSFSHFTYEASQRQLLVCDIQGVGDNYTDPQIHAERNEFGKGNLGTTGMRAFLVRHKCNSICQYLELPALSGLKRNDRGTKAEGEMRQLMAQARAQQAAMDEAKKRGGSSSSGSSGGGAKPSFKLDLGRASSSSAGASSHSANQGLGRGSSGSGQQGAKTSPRFDMMTPRALMKDYKPDVPANRTYGNTGASAGASRQSPVKAPLHVPNLGGDSHDAGDDSVDLDNLLDDLEM